MNVVINNLDALTLIQFSLHKQRNEVNHQTRSEIYFVFFSLIVLIPRGS